MKNLSHLAAIMLCLSALLPILACLMAAQDLSLRHGSLRAPGAVRMGLPNESLAKSPTCRSLAVATLIAIPLGNNLFHQVLTATGWRFSGPALRLLPRALLALLAIGGALWWITVGRKRQRDRMDALDDDQPR